jgi:hypothetical protein
MAGARSIFFDGPGPGPALDLAAEARLDPAVTPEGKTFTFNPTPQHILLTGATGFLGAFLLEGLLRRYPTASVHCHVRAPSTEKGFGRIRQNLQDHLLWCVLNQPPGTH